MLPCEPDAQAAAGNYSPSSEIRAMTMRSAAGHGAGEGVPLLGALGVTGGGAAVRDERAAGGGFDPARLFAAEADDLAGPPAT